MRIPLRQRPEVNVNCYLPDHLGICAREATLDVSALHDTVTKALDDEEKETSSKIED